LSDLERLAELKTEGLLTSETETISTFALLELQRENAHTQEV
jgi:hypothetical protein